MLRWVQFTWRIPCPVIPALAPPFQVLRTKQSQLILFIDVALQNQPTTFFILATESSRLVVVDPLQLSNSGIVYSRLAP